MIDRKVIWAQDRARKAARGQMIDDMRQTREDIRPASILGRWKLRQIRQLAKLTEQSAQFAKRNRMAIGGAAIAALLIIARRPLIATIKKAHEKYRKR